MRNKFLWDSLVFLALLAGFAAFLVLNGGGG